MPRAQVVAVVADGQKTTKSEGNYGGGGTTEVLTMNRPMEK